MIDQAAAEEMTRKIQAALADDDTPRVLRLVFSRPFRELCRELGTRPADALRTIQESMGQEGDDADE